MILAVQVSLTQARIDMSELDEDSDGFLQPHVCFFIFLFFLSLLGFQLFKIELNYLLGISFIQIIYFLLCIYIFIENSCFF